MVHVQQLMRRGERGFQPASGSNQPEHLDSFKRIHEKMEEGSDGQTTKERERDTATEGDREGEKEGVHTSNLIYAVCAARTCIVVPFT